MSVPHLAVPFAFAGDGTVATVEQDSAEEITQCVRVLLGTVTGSRVVVPTYGVPDPTFTGVDPQEVTDAVTEWEPRAAVTVTVADPPGVPLLVTVAVHPEAS